jgi:uncharacterized protein
VPAFRPINDMKTVTIRTSATGITVGTKISVADTSMRRLVGLAGRPRLDAGCGLLISPSSGIHTFGMRFAIDVIGLNKDLQVVKLWRHLSPCRVTSVSLKVQKVLELPAGSIDKSGIDLGDHLEIEPLT